MIGSIARSSLSFLVPFAFAASGHAGVLVVDAAFGVGATHTEIQAAIDAAHEGDTILIRTGNYLGSSFSIVGKSLVIAGDGPHPPFLDGAIEIRDLSASQTVTLSRVQQFALVTQEVGLSIRDCAGPVVVEDCSFTSPMEGGLMAAGLYPAVVVERSHGVVFTRCDLVADEHLTAVGFALPGIAEGPHGLQSLDSNVSLYFCTAWGAAVHAPGKRGGHGAVIAGGSLFASGCSFVGGVGGPASSASPIPGAGGDGVRLSDRIETDPETATVPAVARFVDCVFVGGAGGAGLLNGPDGPDGVAKQVENGAVAIDLPGPSRSFRATSPIHDGGSTTLSFLAPAGESIFLLASPSADPRYLPALSGTLVPNVPLSVFVSAGVMPHSGAHTIVVPIPPSGSGAGSLSVVAQALFVAGGVGRLGSPSTLLLLDPGY